MKTVDFVVAKPSFLSKVLHLTGTMSTVGTSRVCVHSASDPTSILCWLNRSFDAPELNGVASFIVASVV